MVKYTLLLLITLALLGQVLAGTWKTSINEKPGDRIKNITKPLDSCGVCYLLFSSPRSYLNSLISLPVRRGTVPVEIAQVETARVVPPPTQSVSCILLRLLTISL